MLRKLIPIGAMVAGLLLSGGQLYAQPGGGTCGAGMGGTGGMGGAAASGFGGAGRGSGVANAGNGLSQFNMLSQMAAVNQMQQNSRDAATRAAREERLRTTAAQFVRKAMTFDADSDRQLDREELTQVAAAVISELQRGQPAARGSRRGRRSSRKRSGPDDSRGENRMQETFITRAMSFDRNDDGLLNSAEATRMAEALIRSLS